MVIISTMVKEATHRLEVVEDEVVRATTIGQIRGYMKTLMLNI